jgi:hypothetical protein
MVILLPTFVGYFIIAKTSYMLRFKSKSFLYTVIPSAIMIALTFPQIAVELIQTAAYEYLHWPVIIVGYLLLIFHCFGLYKCVVLDSLAHVKAAIIGVFCLIPVSFTLWYLSETLIIPKVMSFMIFESPRFFFAVVSYLCFKESGQVLSSTL